MNRLLLASLVATLALAACSKQEEAAAPAAVTPAAVAEAPKPVGPQAFPPNSGKLIQLVHSGDYTYGEVEGPAGQRVWIAGGHIEVPPGEMVQWGDFAVMHNFTAKSLNRTFDQILFVNSWGPLGGNTATVAAHGSMPGGQHPATGNSGPAQTAAMPGHSGVVKSTTTAAGYTYLEVDQDGQTLWIAAPETQVKVGDKVNWSGGMTMRNFTAKSLDRTFEQIVFAGGVTVAQ